MSSLVDEVPRCSWGAVAVAPLASEARMSLAHTRPAYMHPEPGTDRRLRRAYEVFVRVHDPARLSARQVDEFAVFLMENWYLVQVKAPGITDETARLVQFGLAVRQFIERPDVPEETVEEMLRHGFERLVDKPSERWDSTQVVFESSRLSTSMLGTFFRLSALTTHESQDMVVLAGANLNWPLAQVIDQWKGNPRQMDRLAELWNTERFERMFPEYAGFPEDMQVALAVKLRPKMTIPKEWGVNVFDI